MRIYARLRRICAGSVPTLRGQPASGFARVALPAMRVLVVTNMYPSRERPALGPFVRDQFEALRRRDDVEVELFAFGPGPRALARAALTLGSRYRGRRFDIVHAHFGLTAWPAVLARLGPV